MKFLLLILFFCINTKINFAQLKDNVLPNALLWKISGNGIVESSYLFGTIHSLCKDDFLVDSIVLKKMVQCKEVFFETDFKRKASDSINKSLYLQGTTLKKILGKNEFKKLVNAINHFNSIVIPDLNKYHPFLVKDILLLVYIQCKLVSVDEIFYSIALKNNKTLNYLENAKEHILPIQNLSLEEETKKLLVVLNNLDSIKKSYNDLISLYKNKKISELNLYKANNKKDSIINELDSKYFLDDRNNNWIKKMDTSVKNHSCFFAFGAGHLAGKNGIITLLRALGYEVEPSW